MKGSRGFVTQQPRVSQALPVSQQPTDTASEYYVNGTSLPQVDFDIGESYAGLIPISDDPDETRELFFWFFPSNNPEAANEITVWSQFSYSEDVDTKSLTAE